jgi:outer membrane receptor for ferric coprogen and ferric-rhodotorulic acid
MAIATTPNLASQRTSYYGYKKDSHQALYGGELSLSGTFNLFEREHDLIFGGTWSNNTTKVGSSTSYDNDNRSIYWDSDYLTNPRVSPDDIPSPNLNTTEKEVIKSSLYGAVKYKLLDDLILTVGGRFSNYDEKAEVLVSKMRVVGKSLQLKRIWNLPHMVG